MSEPMKTNAAIGLKAGDKVTGMYHGKQFSGLVLSSASRGELLELAVEITVFGDHRMAILVCCGLSGEEIKGWEGSYLTEWGADRDRGAHR
jgi:hypothetical protein